MPRIHVTGASGTGTSTLARALARELGCPWFDSDDYYWVPTVPPFREKRDPAERARRLEADLSAHDDWAWSGSAVSWSGGAEGRITHCVFLSVPDEIRLPRLRRREEDHGLPPEKIAEFMAWAARYEEGGLDVRSRKSHEAWLATLACPVLRLDGDLTTEERMRRVLDMFA